MKWECVAPSTMSAGLQTSLRPAGEGSSLQDMNRQRGCVCVCVCVRLCVVCVRVCVCVRA